MKKNTKRYPGPAARARGVMFLAVAVVAVFTSGMVQSAAQVIPGQYIVVLVDNKPNTQSSAKAAAARHGARIGHSYKTALGGFAFSGPPAAARMLARDPNVVSVEPDQLVQLDAQQLPTGVDRIEADLNLMASIDGFDDRVDVDVAIIDTGIDIDHPDLPPVVGGRHFFTPKNKGMEDDNYDDDNGHGSHVAGTIAALDNDFGVVGVAPGARLWAVKVLDSDGSGRLSDVIKGVDFVVEHASEIEVVNMSLHSRGMSTALRTAIQAAVNQGVVFVVAASNYHEDVYGLDGIFDTLDDYIPAAYPEVATVSALWDSDGQSGGLGTTDTVQDDTLAYFSNYSDSVVSGNPVQSPGAAIDLAAPGVNIRSTWKDGLVFVTRSGTSMAAPHVTGAVALECAVHGRAVDASGVAAIRQTLINSAQAQLDWGPTDTKDRDINPEGLVYVASGPPNDRPVVTIESPADGATFASGETIDFVGAAFDTEDGDLSASLTWESSMDEILGVGAGLSTALSDGEHTITASVTDSGGKTGMASILITVGDAPTEPTEVSVTSITYTTTRRDKDLLVTVALRDDFGNPVAGASVAIDLLRDNSLAGTLSGSTGLDGTVTMKEMNAPSGTYTSEVTLVSADGLTWDELTPNNSFSK